jgi:hypothetical protein
MDVYIYEISRSGTVPLWSRDTAPDDHEQLYLPMPATGIIGRRDV